MKNLDKPFCCAVSADLNLFGLKQHYCLIVCLLSSLHFLDVDECVSNQTNLCHQQCNNTVGSYQCSCNNGYRFISGNLTHCENIDECKENTSNCHSNARCHDTSGSFICYCRSGFSGNGTYCDDLNECSIGSDNCHSNATCSNNIGSYTCSCKSGFTGNGTYCEDFRECALGTHSCHPNATCANTLGAHICTCKSGFTGNGISCADVNECNGTHNCHVNAVCQNNVGTFICSCKSGYVGNGTSCTGMNEIKIFDLFCQKADFSISAIHGKVGKLMEFNITLHKIMRNSWKMNLVKNHFTSTILR